jgi:hypothetical protein
MRNFCLGAFLAFALAVGTVQAGYIYTSQAAGYWNAAATWTSNPSGGTYPQNADDTAQIGHLVTLTASYPLTTAYVNSGGTLKISNYWSVSALHLNGGALNNSGYTYYDGTVYVDQASSFTGGAIGATAHPVTLNGSGALSYDSTVGGSLILTPASTYNGLVSVVNAPSFYPDLNLTRYGGLYANASGNVIFSTTRTMGCMLYGTAYKNSSLYALVLTFGSGGGVHPGSPTAVDAATLAWTLSSGNAQQVKFDVNSILKIDVTAPLTADLVSITNAAANKVAVISGAKLAFNLPTLAGNATITNLPFLICSAAISGSYAPSDITFSNSTGWSNLTVTKSADNMQLLLNGTYLVPEPATLGLLVLGGIALIRRRR